MKLLDESGHTEVRWETDEIDEVAHARDVFEEQRAKGHLAMMRSLGETANDFSLTRTFNPTAEEYIFIRPICGG